MPLNGYSPWRWGKWFCHKNKNAFLLLKPTCGGIVTGFPQQKLMQSFLTVVFFASVCVTESEAIDADAIHLSADREITHVYINGTAHPLGGNATNWKVSDDYGPVKGLRSVAIRAVAGPPHSDQIDDSGLIGMIQLADGQYVVTDELWRVYHHPSGDPPPKDPTGRDWYHPDYDDSQWQAARPDGGNPFGNYGIPPWGSDAPSHFPQGFIKDYNQGCQLDATMAIGPMPNPDLRANWIWHGNASFAVSPVFFRRVFERTVATADQPPTRPQRLWFTDIAEDSVRLHWQLAWSIGGAIRYRVYWNGLAIAETDQTSLLVHQGVLPGFNIQRTGRNGAQNYFYVTALDSEGNESGSSPHEFPERIESGWSLPALENLRVYAQGRDWADLIFDEPEFGLPYTNSYWIDVRIDGVRHSNPSLAALDTPHGRRHRIAGLKSGTTYRVQARLNSNIGATVGPWSTLTLRTDPPQGTSQIDVPGNVRVVGDQVTWDAPVGSWSGLRYQLFLDGQPWDGRQSERSKPIADLDVTQPHFIQVQALADPAFASRRSAPLRVGAPASEVASVQDLAVIGRTDTSIILDWRRGAPGLAAYVVRRYQGSQLEETTKLNANWQDAVAHKRLRVDGLIPGQTYRFEVLARDPEGVESAIRSVTAATVAPAAGTPVLTFGFAYHGEGAAARRMPHIMHDMRAKGCSLAIIQGAHGGKNARYASVWNALKRAADSHLPHMKTVFSVDYYDNTGQISHQGWPVSKMNELEHDDGNPLHHVWDEGPVRFIRTHAKMGNRREGIGRRFLEQQLLRAERDDVPWLFTIGSANEDTRSLVNDSAVIMKQLTRPVITLDRILNGNPTYDVAWYPGDTWVQTAPRMVRSNAWSYYKVYVYPDRILFEEYVRPHGADDTQPVGSIELVRNVRFEIDYDRSENRIRPSIATYSQQQRIIHGITRPESLGRTVTWAQNIQAQTTSGQSVAIQLLGRSPRQQPLTYTVTRQPAHGRLSGSAPNLTYTPNASFPGDDSFLYRVDDGTRPSNLAWVRISSKEASFLGNPKLGQGRP